MSWEGGLAPIPEGERIPMLSERVRLLAEQSAGAALSTFLGAVLIGFVLVGDIAIWQVVAWVGAYLVPATMRMHLSRRLLRGEQNFEKVGLRPYLGFALFNGTWTGALPLAFFAELSVEARAALTVVSLLSLTAGAATFASYRPGYLCVLGLALPPLVFDWAVFGGKSSWVLVVTLIMFGALMVRLSKHLAEVFERSVEIRFERERVVEQLKLEKAQTEAAKEHAEEASRSKSRFLASASHDLRQPVHALGLFSSVLGATAVSEQHQAIARNISAIGDILKKLLDSLLDISRLDAGIVSVSPQPVAIESLIEQLAEEASSLIGSRPIVVEHSSVAVTALLDPVHIERCLRNLVENACKFTTAGRVCIAATVDQGNLLLKVSDTGIGIPPGDLELVFEEFYQVGNVERDQRKGLGLGLSIVARLAQLMGGLVHVDSVQGQGSAFQLAVPYVPAQDDVVPTLDTRPASNGLQGSQILVVDDEALVRASMREQLRAWGAVVDEADGLAQALSMQRAVNDSWHLCLCDLRLRDGEDGIRTAQRLRELYPALQVILITGDTAPARIEEAARSGFPLLHKPVNPSQLARTIHDVLEA